jgi:hypothetical protein
MIKDSLELSRNEKKFVVFLCFVLFSFLVLVSPLPFSYCERKGRTREEREEREKGGEERDTKKEGPAMKMISQGNDLGSGSVMVGNDQRWSPVPFILLRALKDTVESEGLKEGGY